MVHNKQWIIDKSEHLIDATWRSIPISSGILSYQQNLRIQASKDGKILVLGLVWQIDLDKPSIAEVLNQISSDYDLSNLYKEEETWCGRYAVIYHNIILTDAMGTLGCYYSDNTISSSFKLLNDIINTEGTHQWDSQDIQLTEGNIDYFPGVKTKNNNIKRLLPSQIYNFKEKKCTFRPLSISCFTGMTDNAILKKWEELAVNSLKALSKYVAEPIYCEITGGKDSRTSISVFENACDYELMIWDKEERTRVDIVIAKRIAAVLNRKLHILKMHKREDSPRIAEWDTHCGNLALGRTMYTRHIYDSVSYQPIITVGSNIYELIEDTYAHEFTAADLEEIFATKGAYFKEAMQEWRDLVSKDTINDYIKESIRMYWDLRRDVGWLQRCKLWISRTI